MSVLNLILWVIVLTLIAILITPIIIAIKNSEAINYAFSNYIYCPQTKDCVLLPNDSLDKPDQNWDYLTYNNKVAKIAADLITRIVNEEPAVPYLEWKYIYEFTTSLNSKIFCNIVETESELWLTFRGTDSIKEWLTDIRVKQLTYQESIETYENTPSFMENNNEIMIHNGFLYIFNEIAKEVLTTIEKINQNKEKTICVSGHSLGGAMAAIFGLELHNLNYKTCVYSFASPRIGNIALTETYNSLSPKLPYFRIINLEDEIPQTPTTVSPNFKDAKNPFFYDHFGEVISFSLNAKSVTNNHSLYVYEQNLP